MKNIIRLALCCATLTLYLTHSYAQVTAAFSANTTSGPAPTTIYFTNLSTGATNYVWDFGNGSSSTATNPANIYLNSGSYTVTLTAIGSDGTNISSIPNYITITDLPPVALFFADKVSGAAPLTVGFIN